MFCFKKLDFLKYYQILCKLQDKVWMHFRNAFPSDVLNFCGNAAIKDMASDILLSGVFLLNFC